MNTIDFVFWGGANAICFFVVGYLVRFMSPYAETWPVVAGICCSVLLWKTLHQLNPANKLIAVGLILGATFGFYYGNYLIDDITHAALNLVFIPLPWYTIFADSLGYAVFGLVFGGSLGLVQAIIIRRKFRFVLSWTVICATIFSVFYAIMIVSFYLIKLYILPEPSFPAFDSRDGLETLIILLIASIFKGLWDARMLRSFSRAFVNKESENATKN